ncbi:cbb3-type cytochrome c oxidase subunit I [Dethiobacter alkaliphilus]|uniref:cbb3-type cytochrome c oxidase subunit I n=1 Tax=Dethiobacter alkaliphilus TaxID=427926 RepID=UPI002226A655|nr:cbb3-type cytochrome c oxidase subunit I [Dethiobacter alkaliphilus]MCW3489526.1 cbb3-type cytochrome c oxidase subunit I [Dethiobacter alkaliphilus]
MFKALRQIGDFFFHRHKPAAKKVKEPEYVSQAVAIPYALVTLLLLAFQGLAATFGATEAVFPNLPSPVRAEVGRAVHLNIAVFWPLLGAMGMVYYFFIQEAETELYSLRLAWLQFFVLTASGLGAITFLAFGLMRGMEYREAALVFDLGIAVGLAVFVYNLTRTYFLSAVRGRVTLLGMLSGAISLIILFIPNLVEYVHPTIDEIIRFWVVHMWEELSKELLLIGALVAFLLTIGKARRKTLEKLLFLQLALLIVGATFATGHHYYWIGTPAMWLWIGGIFSVIQVAALFLLAYIFYLGIREVPWGSLNFGARLSLGFAFASVVYHVAGAAMLGMLLAVPHFNRYARATYLTSSHAHLALFGAVGMLVLAGCTYILTRDSHWPKQQKNWAVWGFLLLNGGLIIMGGALAVAGLLQTYLVRIVGLDFTVAHQLLHPYLLMRALGGGVFAVGGLLYAGAVLYVLWLRRHNLLQSLLQKRETDEKKVDDEA